MAHGSPVDSDSGDFVTAWAISDIARVSLSWGGFMRPETDDAKFRRLASLYANVDDELHRGGEHAFARFMARTAVEQFAPQIGMQPALARCAILFGAKAPFSAGRTPKVMKGDWFSEVFGVTLDQYMLGVFFADLLAGSNHGLLNPANVDALETTPFRILNPKAVFWKVFNLHLSTTREQFKETNRAGQIGLASTRLKSSFNPLVDKPFVLDVLEHPVAPSARAIADKLSSRSIFYPASQHFGGGVFSTDLGYIFEAYVGQQLELSQANVWPERPYGPKKTRRDSVDWFVELEDYLVLVECKAIGPNEAVRAGAPEMLDFLVQKLGKGIDQISRSAASISDISAASSPLPFHKQLVGLVVTLEDFFVNNNPFLRPILPSATIPTAIVSVRELEVITSAGAVEANALIARELAASTVPNSFQIGDLDKLPTSGSMNPVLEMAFESFELFRVLDAIKDEDLT